MENVFPIQKNVQETAPDPDRIGEISRLVKGIGGIYGKLRGLRTGLAEEKRFEKSLDKKADLEGRVKELDMMLTALSKFEVAHSRELKRNRIATMIRIAEEYDILVTPPAKPLTIEEAWTMMHRAYELLGMDKGEATILQFPERNRAA